MTEESYIWTQRPIEDDDGRESVLYEVLRQQGSERTVICTAATEAHACLVAWALCSYDRVPA